ncbi:MAG: winged helix-turn-helix domain-containing protein [Actinomycetota bacterium]|nr:winged helix-turn-helix domain-containing protein [Actinomycetota bacterium]
MEEGPRTRKSWTFLSNHGHVLVCIAEDPGIRTRDISDQVGITERATQTIIADLVEAGYIRRTKVGRRNHYEIESNLPLRHSVEQPNSVGDLLELVARVEAEASS